MGAELFITLLSSHVASFIYETQMYVIFDCGSRETKQTFLSDRWYVCVCFGLTMPYINTNLFFF